MTLSESIFWSFARSALIATIALGPVVILLQQIKCCRAVRRRRVWLWLSVVPFFIPDLLIGFHYRLTATQLSSGASVTVAAVCTELLYTVLQLSRCTAAGVSVSLLLTGNSGAHAALFSWRLLKPSLTPIRWYRGWLAIWLTGPLFPVLISWSIMALVVFQEFETAALMQIDRHPVAWSVWLFDAHAARQPLSDSLRMSVLPVILELLLLLPAITLMDFGRTRVSSAVKEHQPESSSAVKSRLLTFLALGCVTPGLALFVIWPLISNASMAIHGLASITAQRATFLQAVHQIVTSAGFAMAATFITMNLSLNLLGRLRPERSQMTVHEGVSATALVRSSWGGSSGFLFFAGIIPGLMGSLVVSLLLLALFQLPFLRAAYDSWLPLLLGQVLAVLPRGIMLAALLGRTTDSSAVFTSRLLFRSSDAGVRKLMSRILWRMTTGRWLLGGLLVGHWCFWDVTVASILRPVRLEPVVTRLYNEMHYGRTEALLGLAFLAILTPMALGALIFMAGRVHHRGDRHRVR